MKRLLKAAVYALAAFLVASLSTCFGFVAAIKWSAHRSTGVGHIYGVGFPSLCMGMLAMIVTFVLSLKKSTATH
jgi:hypothetical protein